MNIDEVMPTQSKFIKADDLQGRDVPVTIAGVRVEPMDNGEHKPVVYFQGKEKGLVLNMTNKNTIKDLYGAETDLWPGKPLVLVTIWTDYQGRQVKAIRVRPPMNGPQQGGYVDHQAPPEQRQQAATQNQMVQDRYNQDQGHDNYPDQDDHIPVF